MTPNIDVKIDERNKIVQLCVDFLGFTWTRVKFDDIICKRISTGLGNKSYYCSIKECDEASTIKDDEHSEVIVRVFESDLFTGNKIKFNGELAEPVVTQILSTAGIAPKVLGVFDKGIISEYIENDVATVEDLSSVELSKAFIRHLAKFHSQNVPISKKPDFVDKCHQMNQVTKNLDEIYNNLPEEEKSDFKVLLDFPLKEDREWLKAAISKVGMKLILSHNDMNPNNILLRKNYSSIDDRIILVDYECCSYFYRAHDISSFLRARNVSIKREDSKVTVNFEHNNHNDDIDRREILREYLAEWIKLNPEDAGTEYDNLERLEMEVEFFEFVADHFIVMLMLTIVCESTLQIPLAAASHIVSSYRSRKCAFLKKYGDPVNWK